MVSVCKGSKSPPCIRNSSSAARFQFRTQIFHTHRSCNHWSILLPTYRTQSCHAHSDTGGLSHSCWLQATGCGGSFCETLLLCSFHFRLHARRLKSRHTAVPGNLGKSSLCFALFWILRNVHFCIFRSFKVLVDISWKCVVKISIQHYCGTFLVEYCSNDVQSVLR